LQILRRKQQSSELLQNESGGRRRQNMSERTIKDLMQMQALPLEAKISMSRNRIKAWINEYGEEGVYISFSGGKDSTVLLDIVRNVCGYNKVPAVFVDVPTQYPKLREFAKTFDNVEILKPKISFMEVCRRYGFPLISKEVSGAVYEAKRYLQKIDKLRNCTQTDSDGLLGVCGCGNIPDELYKYAKDNNFKIPARLQILYGEYLHKEKGILTDEYSKQFDKSRYKFFLSSKFDISDRCCKIMKKEPLHAYNRRTGRNPMTAQMADESRLRTSHWIKNGCNGFDMKSPISNPLSFWTEQDILKYIKTRKLPICSVYGEIVPDFEKMGMLKGQSLLFETGEEPLKTTGCKRTGCMLCGFGCHLEKSPNRFEMLKETHPKMYNLLDVCKNNGVTFREAIEWTNENGGFEIKL
jgi:3'-phosphoadenosine 5'-phosphosulfate sulfotransferase (PAPS reductase)/FAD synthetase